MTVCEARLKTIREYTIAQHLSAILHHAVPAPEWRTRDADGVRGVHMFSGGADRQQERFYEAN